MTVLLRLSLLALLALAVFLAEADTLLLADLAQHFRPQLAVLALGGAGVALLLRRRSEAAGALLVALLLGMPVARAVLPAGLGSPIHGASAAHATGGEPARLTLVSANLLYTNTQPDRMVDALLAADADVLVLIEVIPSWKAVTGRLRARYPYRTPDEWWAGTSTVVWSRYPLDLGEQAMRRLAQGSVLDVTLQVGERPLRLFAIHAPRPRTVEVLHQRNAVFDQLAGWTAEREVPTVLAGDFNATPWTPSLRRLTERADLRRGQPARGWYASWPASLEDLGIPIDQLLHAPGVEVENFQVLTIPGSDHRALRAQLLLP